MLSSTYASARARHTTANTRGGSPRLEREKGSTAHQARIIHWSTSLVRSDATATGHEIQSLNLRSVRRESEFCFSGCLGGADVIDRSPRRIRALLRRFRSRRAPSCSFNDLSCKLKDSVRLSPSPRCSRFASLLITDNALHQRERTI